MKSNKKYHVLQDQDQDRKTHLYKLTETTADTIILSQDLDLQKRNSAQGTI